MLGSLFDASAEFFIHERRRPHWSQAGTVVYATARTCDSLPKEVLLRWEREKNAWFHHRERRLGVPVDFHRGWQAKLNELNEQDLDAFRNHFNRRRETELDCCHGACWLKEPVLAKIVSDSLMHFDGSRYRMGDFVVMPNHFHALVVFRNPEDMERQFDSWLQWTATQINRRIGARGHFWQQEPFDHLVRSAEQYTYLREYIRDNPNRANLREGQFLYRRLEE
jgi:putative transposase